MINNIFQPAVSFIIPTYNSAETISNCLASIRSQNYPQENIEIIIIDGCSSDKTKEICAQFNCLIIDNPEIIHPVGRAIGIKQARGELLAFIDSDNILIGNDWLSAMVEPFIDRSIVSSGVLYFSSRNSDSWINKYISLIGADDPIALYLGFYDRYSYITNKWTASDYLAEDKGNYLKLKFTNLDKTPPLGANGYLARKTEILKTNFDPFWHTSVARQLLNFGYHGKVKVGIIHVHANSLRRYVLKKIRRIKRRKNLVVPKDDYQKFSPQEIYAVACKCLIVVPVIIDAIKGFSRKPSYVWVFHPFLVYLTFFIYVFFQIYWKKDKKRLYERV